MTKCTHDLADWQQQDEAEMHSLGWVCRICGELQLSEYHHRTWCGREFCGCEPIGEPTRELVCVGQALL